LSERFILIVADTKRQRATSLMARDMVRVKVEC